MLTLTGPLLDSKLWCSPFAHHNDYLKFFSKRDGIALQDVPSFYLDPGGDGDILEYPWPTMWGKGRLFYVYQEIHGREVVVSTYQWSLKDERLKFRNMCLAQPKEFLASRARYVVIHLDLAAESKSLIKEVLFTEKEKETFQDYAQKMASRLEELWGSPFYQDDKISVWDLEKKRASRNNH